MKKIVTQEGKKYELVRSAYKSVNIFFENGEMRVDAIIREDVAEKPRRLWISMRYQ